MRNQKIIYRCIYYVKEAAAVKFLGGEREKYINLAVILKSEGEFKVDVLTVFSCDSMSGHRQHCIRF